MYIKENIDDFIELLKELDVSSYVCHNQKNYIITIDNDGKPFNMEILITNNDEQRKLNYTLRKLTE